MLSRRIERILKEKDRYARMLEYYDATGKLPTRKVAKTFTLEQMNVSVLEEEAERTGRKMSQIVDQILEERLWAHSVSRQRHATR